MPRAMRNIIAILWLCSTMIVVSEPLRKDVAKAHTVVKCIKQRDDRWLPEVLRAPATIPRKDYPRLGAIWAGLGRNRPADCIAYYYIEWSTGPTTSSARVVEVVSGEARWKEAGRIVRKSARELDLLVEHALEE